MLRRATLYGTESRRTSLLRRGEFVLRSLSEDSFDGPRGAATPDTTSTEDARLARSRSMSREEINYGGPASNTNPTNTTPTQSGSPAVTYSSDGGNSSPSQYDMGLGAADRVSRPPNPGMFSHLTPQQSLYGPGYLVNPAWPAPQQTSLQPSTEQLRNMWNATQVQSNHILMNVKT